MDPDANLAEFRRLCQEILNNDDNNTAEAVELAELAGAMDGWLSNGGFLPKAWQRPAT